MVAPNHMHFIMALPKGDQNFSNRCLLRQGSADEYQAKNQSHRAGRQAAKRLGNADSGNTCP